MAGTSDYIVSRVAEYNENQALSHTYYSFFSQYFLHKAIVSATVQNVTFGGRGANLRKVRLF